MAKIKNRDPGLEYLRKIGFNRIRGKYGLHDRFIQVFGRSKADQIMNDWNRIGSGSPDFYDFKNSDIEISKGFSEAYDYDIIRKACNYVSSHKEYFGKTILEVGCESGYMTGFLAMTFPESRIVSIDHSKNAVNIASQRINSMGLSNVEFKVCSLADVSEQFDTVFCMRTIQENFNSNEIPFSGEPILWQFMKYGELTHPYTSLLQSCLTGNGLLVVFERVGHDPLMCGWMIDLCQSNCAPILNTYSEIQCIEVDQTNTFQAFVCRNGVSDEPQKMYDLWYKAIHINPTGEAILTGWNALLYLANNAGNMISGVRIYNNTNQIGRFAIFYDKDAEPTVYYLQATSGNGITLLGVAIEGLDSALINLQNVIQTNTVMGCRIEEMSQDEDYLEGNLK